MAKTVSSKVGGKPPMHPTHSTILVVAIELLAIGLFTLLAGINNEWGKIMVILMLGFWLIYLITTFSVIQGLGNALGNVAQQAQG